MHARVFAALANPARHEIVHLLCEGERTPGELADILEISKPNLSQHLAVLQREGLVTRTRDAGQVYFQIIDPRLTQGCALIDEMLGRVLSDRVHVLESEATHVLS